jgi:hypothetical protein
MVQEILDKYCPENLDEMDAQTAVKIIRLISDQRRKADGVAPIPPDARVWKDLAPSAIALLELARDPNSFRSDHWVTKGVLKRPEKIFFNPLWKYQKYYTRILRHNTPTYLSLLEKYINKHPTDVAYATVHAESNGLGAQAGQMANQKWGIETADSSPSNSPSEKVVFQYHGTTQVDALNRFLRDVRPEKGRDGSRAINLTNLTQENQWEILEWPKLSVRVTSSMDFRKQDDLGYRESILTDLCPLALNSARGGFVSTPQLDSDIVEVVKSLQESLPPEVEVEGGSEELQTDLIQMMDDEVKLMKKIHRKLGAKWNITSEGTAYVKKELTEHLRVVNGLVSSLTILKDAPQEMLEGLITPQVYGDDAGRGMALHRRLLEAIVATTDTTQVAGDPDSLSSIIRNLTGALLDFWRYLEEHELFGLIAVLTGLYIRRIRPILLQSRSSIMAHLILSDKLWRMPSELGLENSSGPEAMASIDSTILQHSAVQNSRNSSKSQKFLQHLGNLELARFGPGPLDWTNVYFNQDAASPFYRQQFFRFSQRRLALLTIKFHAIQRVTEWHMSQLDAEPTEPQDLIDFLEAIRKSVATIAESSGLESLLRTEIERYCKTEAGFSFFLNLQLADKVSPHSGSTSKPKRKEKEGLPRNHGLQAVGQPGSNERRAQLQTLVKEDALRKGLGMDACLVWKQMRPSDPAFEKAFMKLEAGFSLLRSAAGFGTTEEAREVREREGKRLNEWNKSKALRDRKERALRVGGEDLKGEQLDRLTTSIRGSVKDQTKYSFDDRPRLGICKGCNNLVLGKDRNAKHRCPQKGKDTIFSKTTCDEYEWILHPHDALDHEWLTDAVRTTVLGDLQYNRTPAQAHLSGEKQPPFEVKVDRVVGDIYLPPHNSDRNLALLMAWDRALQSQCSGADPLDVAVNAGKVISKDAEEKFASKKHEYWSPRFVDMITKTLNKTTAVNVTICLRCGDFKLRGQTESHSHVAQHAPCTSKTGDRGKQFYHIYKAKNLADLPYSIARTLLYYAYRDPSENALRTALDGWAKP